MNIEVALIIFPLCVSITLQDYCGDSVVGSGFVVGGSRIKRGQWPFIAALFRSQNEEYFCGGTIISHKHVMTAAHCIHPKYGKSLESKDLVVHLGRYNISRKNESDSTVSKVVEITVHPDWDQNTVRYDADIAILQLEASQELSNFVKIICWPTQDDAPIGEGIVVGWGYSEQTNFSKVEDIAKQTALKAVSNEFCFLHRREFTTLSSNRTFCAGGDGECFTFIY